jgi:hypothetical protein
MPNPFYASLLSPFITEGRRELYPYMGSEACLAEAQLLISCHSCCTICVVRL